jgi:hypothetical protein
MEHSAPAQTMQDFFAPSKALRVWLIVFAALTSLMIVGASYEFTRPGPEPVRMTHETRDETYVYLDVLLLSDWIYDVSGDETYTYYEAMDPDANWFIVSLDKDAFSSLGQHVDAYNAYFTDGYLRYDYPAPTRLTGMAGYLDYDDTSALADYYEVSFSDFEQFFGSYYFHEGASADSAGAALYLVGAITFGLILLVIALQISSLRRHYRASDERLYALGLTDEAENQFSDPATLRYPKLKLALSSDFVYIGSSGYLLPYSDVTWLYKRVQKSYGVPVATHLMAGLVNGKSICLAARRVNDAFIVEVAQKVLSRNPDCLIGYSFDNAKVYRQRVREFKAASTK